MPLTRLIVQQFRNIKACDMPLSTGFNFIIGPNGSGKTSVLEAIYMLGHGRSFKSSLTGRIIQNECQELFVHGRFLNSDQFEIPIGINKQRDGSTEVRIGGQSGQKLAQLAEVLPLQLIHPEGFELLTDGPKFRRAFIDWGVFHSQPQFYEAWGRFKRFSKQRNALLKTARSYKELSYWDKDLALLAEQIDSGGQRMLNRCNPLLKKCVVRFSLSLKSSLVITEVGREKPLMVSFYSATSSVIRTLVTHLVVPTKPISESRSITPL